MGSERSQKLQRARSRTNPDSHAPSTPVESLAKRTAYTRAAATTTKARRRAEKTEVPSSVTTSSLKPRRVRGLRDWDSQITLTQIVSQTESSHAEGDGDLLEYDGREHRDARADRDVEVIDLVNDSEDDSVPRTSRRESTAKKTRTRRSPDSIPRTTFKPRKSVGFDRNPKKNTSLGKSKIGGAALKKGIDGNKTLTQMDFVRRYIPLPLSDDDLKAYDEELLESTSNSPSKAVPESNTEDHGGQFLSPRKRRKLSNDSARSPSPQAIQPSPIPFTLPETPQKVRKFEIPSSQTPETPRPENLASADVHNVSRFSLEKHTTSISSAGSEELLQQPNEVQAQSSSQVKSTIPETVANSVSQDTRREEGGPSAQSTASVFDSTQPQPPGTDRAQESSKLPGLPPSSFSKTVVYDTDDEDDDLEGDDGASQLPRPENNVSSTFQHPTDGEEEPGVPDSDDSNDLPPHVPNSGTDLDINCNTFSDTALPSDMSLYYRRPAQYTQYPAEPVPILNTQKMAELFPVEEGEEPLPTPKAPSHLDKENWLHSKNEHADVLSSHSEAPIQSDEAQKSTQIVPESSPIARHHEDEIMPPPREPPVVLVESSQLVDRINRQNSSLDTGPAPPRLLSARDFLTDSVMESVPPPPWALSQDSVGEPYPEESRK